MTSAWRTAKISDLRSRPKAKSENLKSGTIINCNDHRNTSKMDSIQGSTSGIIYIAHHSSIFALRIYTTKYIPFFGALENIYDIYHKISIYTKIDYCIGVVYLGYSLRILVRKLHFRAPSACVLHFGNHAPSASSLYDVIVKCLYDVV